MVILELILHARLMQTGRRDDVPTISAKVDAGEL
jgi:hypothetical protein